MNTWNGEGLPPIGTVCEWKEKTGFQWVAAKVLFITEKSVVLQRSDGFEWQMVTARAVFRPIRTAEQIAAEERKKEILQMIDVFGTDTAIWGLDAVREICGHLWAAGYRKQ